MAERRRAEADLVRLNRELQRRITEFQTLLDVIPIGIAVAEDPECRHVWANSWLSNLLGVAPGENVSATSQPPDAVTYRLYRDGQELPLAEHPMQYAATHREVVRDVEVDVMNRDGRAVQLLGYASPLFDEAGQVRGCLGTYVDITERRQMEAQLRAALHEKEVLLREIHHRVKNNLQVVSSLLDLQAEVAEDPRVRTVFEESQHRIQAMALIHESLYLSDALTHIDAAAYIKSLSERLFDATHPPESRITLTLETQPVMLTPQTAIPCGLLLNELLSNALKHAFPDDRRGAIHIALRQKSSGQCILTVRDSGVGFPAETDFRTTESLGLQLVCLLTEQLGGTIALERNGGTVFTITFPL
jgi:two-component sensor histidine kinase